MKQTLPTDDFQLWQSFKKGDEDAFTIIYRQHVPALYSYGMRLLSDEDAVMDTMHSLFIKLWNHRATIGSTGDIRFFLLRSLKNMIITYRSKESRTHPLDVSKEAPGFVFDVNPESVYIEREEQSVKLSKLTAAIDQLSSRQKEIIYLKYFEELDYSEIADIMGITVKGAYKLSARAIDSLKEILKSPKSAIIAALLMLKMA